MNSDKASVLEVPKFKHDVFGLHAYIIQCVGPRRKIVAKGKYMGCAMTSKLSSID